MKRHLFFLMTNYTRCKKNMLMTLLAAVAVSSMNKVCGQSFEDLTGPTFKASIDAAKEKEKGNSAIDKKANIGFNVGAYFATMFGYRVNKNEVGDFAGDNKQQEGSGFFLSEGIQYISKGSKDKEGEAKTKLGYIELLVSLVYYKELSAGCFYAGLGPYFSYGIGGKVSGSGFSEKAFGSEGYKRFDAGPRIMVGYMSSAGVSVDLAYELGLVNKSPDPSDYTSKNRAFSLNIGYSLRRLFSKSK